MREIILRRYKGRKQNSAYLLTMISHSIVTNVDTHLLSETTIVGGVGGSLPRHTQLGERSAGHTRSPGRQRRTQSTVVKLIYAQSSGNK